MARTNSPITPATTNKLDMDSLELDSIKLQGDYDNSNGYVITLHDRNGTKAYLKRFAIVVGGDPPTFSYGELAEAIEWIERL